MPRFVSIVKPGIIFGNIITVSGGFFLGTQSHFHGWLFCITLIGMSLVIASGCVFNNYIDRDIDKLMERTKNRVLAQGLIAPSIAILYGTLLGLLGFLILYCGSNLLTVGIAFIGWFFYVVVYSLFWKRRSSLGTLIGGISGAVPPVIGYTAVTNHFDAGAIILFLILFFWQIPHFYAIALFRLKDYTAAAIPLLPIISSIQRTKIYMLLYTIAFAITALLPSFYGYTGIIYFITALVLGMAWIILCVQGLGKDNDQVWARKMFGWSILIITILSIAMIIKF